MAALEWPRRHPHPPQDADLARGWTEKDADGLDGWVALVDGRIVSGAQPGTLPEPVVHAEAWEAGATLHAALAQHPAQTAADQDEDDGQEDGLLGDVHAGSVVGRPG